MEKNYFKKIPILKFLSAFFDPTLFMFIWTITMSCMLAKLFRMSYIYQTILNLIFLIFEIFYYCYTYASISHYILIYKFIIVTTTTFCLIPFLKYRNPYSLTICANFLTLGIYFSHLTMRKKRVNDTYLLKVNLYGKITKNLSSEISNLSFLSVIVAFIVPLMYLVYGFIVKGQNRILFDYSMQCLYACILGCLWASGYEIVDAIFSQLDNVLRKDSSDEALFITKAINSKYCYIQVLGYERLAFFSDHCIHLEYLQKMDTEWLIGSWRFFLSCCEKKLEEYAELLNKVVPAMDQNLHPNINSHKYTMDFDIRCEYIQQLHNMSGIICPCIVTIKGFYKLRRIYLNIEEYPFFTVNLNNVLIVLIQIEVLLHGLNHFKKEGESGRSSFSLNLDQKMLYGIYKNPEDHITSSCMLGTLESCLCATLKNTMISYLKNSLNGYPKEKLYVSNKIIINTVNKYKNCLRN